MMDNTVVIGVLLAIAAGVGTTLRWTAATRLNSDFPLGTLGVNLVASILLGIIAAADDPLPAIVGLGALGALSTWSAIANEVSQMAREGQGKLAAGYLGLTCTSGILAAWFGLKIGAALF